MSEHTVSTTISEEQAQTETTAPAKQTMSENAETKDAEIQDVPTQLFAAKKLINEDKFEPAVDMLTTLLESLSKEAQVQNPLMAELYHFYGMALFRLSQSQNDVFGAPIREKQAEYAALQAVAEDGEEDDTEMTEANDTAEQDAKESSPNPTVNIIPEQSDAPTNETSQENGADQEANGDAAAALADAFASVLEQAHVMKDQMEAAAASGDVDTSEDRELAWESLETARGLLAESTDPSHKNLLAETHLLLAELQLEDEAFDGAAGDFSAAIQIYRDIHAKPRVIAAAYYLWGVSSGYNENHALAKEQFEMSADLMLKQICEMSEQTVDAGGPKSEEGETFLLGQKEELLIQALKFCEGKDEQVKQDIEDLIGMFEETVERIEESSRVEAEKMEVDRVMNEENSGDVTNGVTTIGFGPVDATSAPVNNLGVITKKKKRTAESAGLEEPAAKKQRVD